MLLFTLTLACTKTPETLDTAPQTVPFSRSLARIDPGEQDLGGHVPARSILHLHSPWSHDACDGDPLPDGAPNAPCLADLRAAICEVGLDVASLTDHPTHAAAQDYDTLTWAAEGDRPELLDGVAVGNHVACPDGRSVLVLPGIEDTLMPQGLRRHVEGDAAARDALYNRRDDEAIAAMVATGAVLTLAHTEGETIDELTRLQDAGLVGLEAFNLHAMVDPNIREESLGLDSLSWLSDIADFTNPDGVAEPDLLFLAVVQEQAPSILAWDTLSAQGPTFGFAGTDAHQNALPIVMRDGERGDSYRRMMRWFSNWLLLSPQDATPGEAVSAKAVEDAQRAGRGYIVFEAFGTPADFDVALYDDAGARYEIGADAPAGELVVRCPRLAALSPRGPTPPEISAVVLKDGQPFAAGCGAHSLADPGVYRVVFTITPLHLSPFLGEDPASHMREAVWIYANPHRVR